MSARDHGAATTRPRISAPRSSRACAARGRIAWFREHVASAPVSAPPLGLHLLLGQSFRAAFGNMLRNLEEGRLVVFEAVYRRK